MLYRLFCASNAAFTYLHLILQSSHVSLLHQFVQRHKLSKALSHSHDLGLFGQVQRQIQSRVQPHLLRAVAHMEGFKSTPCGRLVHISKHYISGYSLQAIISNKDNLC